MALDDRHLGDVVGRIGDAFVAPGRHRLADVIGDDAAGRHADHREFACRAGNAEIGRADDTHLDAVETDRRDRLARREQRIVDDAAGRDHRLHRALLEVADQNDIGAAAGRDHAAVLEAEGIGRRPARGAIDVVQRPAEGNQRAHHVVEVALLGDVERVAIVGAQAAHARRILVEDLGERMQVLGHRALADEHGEALLQLLAAVLGNGGLVVGANARGEIAVEVVAAHQRRMAVDMAVLEGDELVEDVVAARQNAGKVHELGKADHLGVRRERDQVRGQQFRAGGLEGGRRHAGGELHAQVHDRGLGRLQEEADAFEAEHVGDLVRIADRRGDAMGQHAAVEFLRRDQRGFDVEMGVDEAGHGEEAAAVDLARALIGRVGADDAIARDGDVGHRHAAIDDVEQADIPDDQIGGRGAPALVDGARRERLCRSCSAVFVRSVLDSSP